MDFVARLMALIIVFGTTACLVKLSCVFRLMPATDSTASRPPIPRHAGRGFHGMSATP
jgi:hypothetical protein